MRLNCSISGLFFDIDRFATHDGPGIRTIVFLKGCPLRCRWCHSPESQSSQPQIIFQPERCTACWQCVTACPTGALQKNSDPHREAVLLDFHTCTACGDCLDVCYSNALRMAGTRVTVGTLVEEVSKDLPFFERSGGGVTVSGGEPLLQPDFTYHFLAACKRRGIHTALETSGYAPWSHLRNIAAVTDFIMYDVKMLDPDQHQLYTGVSNQRILRNLQQLASYTTVQVRVPCIPEINDSEAQIHALATYLAGIGIADLALLPYNAAAAAKYQWIGRAYPMAKKQTQTEEYMRLLATLCAAEGLQVQIGG